MSSLRGLVGNLGVGSHLSAALFSAPDSLLQAATRVWARFPYHLTATSGDNEGLRVCRLRGFF
jgi:hypothetical protein